MKFATIGLFVVLAGFVLYLCRTLLLPLVTAAVVATTLAPVIRQAARHGIPPVFTALALVAVIVALLAVTVTMISDPLREWIARAPEIGATIREKFAVLDRPLAAVRTLQDAVAPRDANVVQVDNDAMTFIAPMIAFLTPALGQTVLFFGVLVFYLIGQTRFRRKLVAQFASRDSKLRSIRIINAVERNLSTYLATVTVINVTLGMLVAVGAWLLGLPHPMILGFLAGLFNFVPYLGPALTAIILFVVALMSFDVLGHIFSAPALFLCLTTLEGQFITPAILGRRLTLDPLVVVLALAFWTWIWGPVGALLAVPLSIIGLVITNHLSRGDNGIVRSEGTLTAASH